MRQAHFNLRLLLAPTYREDGLCTVHNSNFKREPKFLAAYNKALEMQPNTDLHWRTHVVIWASETAFRLDGNFVECGVNRSFFSTAIFNYLKLEDHQNKHFYLFDTFNGLDKKYISDKDKAAHFNEYHDVYDLVKKAFGKFKNVHVIRGSVPDTLAEIDVGNVSYLSIDMNCSYPEKKALEYFWPKLVVGGVIVLDDYGWKGHEEQKKVADDFAAKKNRYILCLPTGQGIIIK